MNGTPEPAPVEAVDSRLLDRLVDGALPDDERRRLLPRLDSEPGGWRRCALAFLEAQALREALGPVAAPVLVPRRTVPAAVRGRWPGVARLTALAASLAAAFVLGRAASRPAAPPGPVLSEPPAVAVAEPAAPAAAKEPEVLAVLPAPAAEAPESPLAPLVRRWEQQGYRAETRPRLASVALPDGRQVQVPVQEVRLRSIRDRTY